jgi:hypothetical protein
MDTEFQENLQSTLDGGAPLAISRVPSFFGGGVRLDLSRGEGNEWVNLNDLWRAAGSPDNKKPWKWLENDRTLEYLRELGRNLSQNPISGFECFRVVRGGNDPGTWAHNEAAIRYGMWLSVQMEVRVIAEWKAYTLGKLGARSAMTTQDVTAIVRSELDSALSQFDSQFQALASRQDDFLASQQIALEELARLHGQSVYVCSELQKLKEARGCIGIDDIQRAKQYVRRIALSSDAVDDRGTRHHEGTLHAELRAKYRVSRLEDVRAEDVRSMLRWLDAKARRAEALAAEKGDRRKLGLFGPVH